MHTASLFTCVIALLPWLRPCPVACNISYDVRVLCLSLYDSTAQSHVLRAMSSASLL